MRARIAAVVAGGAAALGMMGAGVHAQVPHALSRAMLTELTGFVHAAYFNANRFSDMPKLPKDRAATQPEVLSAVASAMRVRQRACASVVDVQYVDDTGYNLAITCSDGRYVVDAGRGKITP